MFSKRLFFRGVKSLDCVVKGLDIQMKGFACDEIEIIVGKGENAGHVTNIFSFSQISLLQASSIMS